MQQDKTHVLFIRNVSKEQKDSLKRLAKERNQSVNGYLLTRIGEDTDAEIAIHKLPTKSKKQ